MQHEHYYLKTRSLDGINYVFKRPQDEQLMMDPDLEYGFDVLYKNRSDAHELLGRTFTLQDATSARAFLLEEFGQPDELWPFLRPEDIELVRVNPADPLATFVDEARLLRILEWEDSASTHHFDAMSFALASSRGDGARTDERLFFRRSGTERPVECFVVEAMRLGPRPALVKARYGHPFATESGPRARAERFRFVDWGSISYSTSNQDGVTGACRLLQKDEAIIALSLSQELKNFRDVRIVSGSFRELDGADEGLFVTQGDQPYSKASPEGEAKAGFPHFLSVFEE
jgi:hypothetical protein